MEARVLTRYFLLVHLAFMIINGHPILDSLYILGDDAVDVDLRATKDLYGLQETQFLLKTKVQIKDLRDIVKIIAERHRQKMSVDYTTSIHRENFFRRVADKNNEDLVSDSKYSQLSLEQIENRKKSNITRKNQSTGNSHQEEVNGNDEKSDRIQNGRRSDQRRFEITLINEIYNLIREALSVVNTLPEKKKKIVEDFSNIIEEDDRITYGADYHEDFKDALLKLYADTRVLYRELLNDLVLRNGRKTLLMRTLLTKKSYHVRNFFDFMRRSQVSENPSVSDEIAAIRNYEDFKRSNIQLKDDTTGMLNVELDKSAHQEPTNRMHKQDIVANKTAVRSTSKQSNKKNRFDNSTFNNTINGELGKDEKSDQIQNGRRSDQRRFEITLIHEICTLIRDALSLVKTLPEKKKKIVEDVSNIMEEDDSRIYGADYHEDVKDGLLNLYFNTRILHREIIKDSASRSGRKTLLVTSYYLRNLFDIWRRNQVSENPPVYEEIAARRNYEDLKRSNTQLKDDTTGTLNVELDKSAHQEPTNRMYKQDIVANETAARSGFDHLWNSTNKKSKKKNRFDNSKFNNTTNGKLGKDEKSDQIQNGRRAHQKRFEITLIHEIYNLIREALSLFTTLPEKKKKIVQDFSNIIEEDSTRYGTLNNEDVKDELLNLYVNTRILHRELIEDLALRNGRKTLLATSYYLRNLFDIWRRSQVSENPRVSDEMAGRRNYEDLKRSSTQLKDDTTGTLNVELDKSAHQEPTNRMHKQDIVANKTAVRSTSKQSNKKNRFDNSTFNNTINGELGKYEKSDQIQNGRRADQSRFEMTLIHEIYNLIREALSLFETLPEKKKKIVEDFSNIIEEDSTRHGADYHEDVKDGLLNLYIHTRILHREIIKDLVSWNGRKTLLATSYYLRNLFDIWRRSQVSENPPVYEEIAGRRNYEDLKRSSTQLKDDTTGTLNVELDKSAHQEPTNRMYKQDIVANETAARSGFDHLYNSTSEQSKKKNQFDNSTLNNSLVSKEHSTHHRNDRKGDAKLLKDLKNDTKDVSPTYNNKASKGNAITKNDPEDTNNFFKITTETSNNKITKDEDVKDSNGKNGSFSSLPKIDGTADENDVPPSPTVATTNTQQNAPINNEKSKESKENNTENQFVMDHILDAVDKVLLFD